MSDSGFVCPYSFCIKKLLTVVTTALLLAACNKQPVNPGLTNQPAAPAQEFFEPKDIQPGQKIGTMTVISNDYDTTKTKSGIHFSGTMDLTGNFKDFSAQGGMAPAGICMFVLDPATKIGLPVPFHADLNELEKGVPSLRIAAATASDYEDTICFDRADAISKGFTKATEGTATVAISSYFLNLSGLEGKSSTAEILQVIAVTPTGTVKNIE